MAISRVLGHETFVYVPATVTSLPNNMSLTLGMLSYQSFTSQAPQIVHSGHVFQGKSHVPLFKITETSVTEDQRDGTRPQWLPPHPTLAAQKDTQPLSLSAALPCVANSPPSSPEQKPGKSVRACRSSNYLLTFLHFIHEK